MRYVLPITALGCSILVAVASCSGGSNEAASNGLGGGDFASSSTSTSSGQGAHHASSTSASTTSGFQVGDGGPGDGDKCATAQTCESAKADCGKIPDGCGGILDCGTCKTGEVCGAINPSECGVPPCMAKTCADQDIECGPAGDLCGNALDCGTCPTGQTCGGGGSGKCGKKMQMCKPKSCMDQGLGCGMAGDLCGHTIDCGTCTLPDTCGGVTSGQCGHVQCIPQKCSDTGADCGQAPDGCGALLDCGTCSLPKTCGGNGGFNKCGIPPTCTNLCLQQVTCAGGGTTTFSGTVYAPNGTDPMPNVLVYVPNSQVAQFGDTVSCDNCSSSVSGDPLVSAVTDTSGNFQIQNMPTGSNIPIVVQTGRWREQYNVSSVTACVDNAPDGMLKLPSTQLEGCTSQPCATNIPHMAFATGSYDALECVLRKVGVADSEFGAPGDGGRIDLYVGNTTYQLCINSFLGICTDSITEYGGGANAPGQSAGQPKEPNLWATDTALDQYDMVLLPCQGNEYARKSADQQRLIDYANAGGRLFTTHYSYVWLYNDSPFSGTANWDLNQVFGSNDSFPPNQTGYINMSFPKGAALAQWLVNVCPQSTEPANCTTLGQTHVNVVRDDNDSVIAPSTLWMYGTDPQSMVLHYTFNTPIGADPTAQCGRVLFDDFHVEDREKDYNTVVNDGYATGTYGYTFPDECDNNAMTPQEQLLEFMIFDLGSCVTPDVPTCTSKTCGDLNIDCGPAGDGCGNELKCGDCPTGEVCGLGGPSKCGKASCTPISCSDQNISCGPASDGCGNLQQCGNCPAGKSCGGGGMPGKCGGGGSCTRQSCADQNLSCGPAGDGCGGMLDCGVCPMGQTCGGGGTPGQCGTECNKLSCVDQGFNCGPAGDGCGGEIMCGQCSPPQSCGGGGQANVCGGSAPH